MAQMNSGESHPRNDPWNATTPASPRTPGRGRYLPRGTVWVLLPILSLGLLAPFTFTYAAVRRRSPVTVIAAVVFVMLTVTMFASVDTEWVFDIALGLNLVGSICAAIALRPHVFRVTEVPVDQVPAARPGGPGPQPGEAEPTRMLSAPHQQRPGPPNGPAHARAAARALAHEEPSRAVELGIGRPDRQTGYDDGGLIDLNRAPAAGLAQLPGLASHHVEALLQSRASEGAFLSLEDAMIRAEIPPHLENQLAEYAIVY
ncbi:hypothetical protein RIF23_14950 [Lipingzhangella sp. LS1_29]|uniref:Helix-hairpin-helix domain-containing protein n=1 Tax=Lipingzhangella rawalii TaxID=2055835 RepID=A0ABU2H8F7_9ACTN|nr:hypothetical protein [Lipingzhangella rawalii]MDS1271591.1 hypothetical protein [Lipingzhangella rawalii]